MSGSTTGRATADFWHGRSVPSGLSSTDIERLATLVLTGSEERIPVCAPYTGQQLGTIPSCTVHDVAHAVRKARAAQPEWARRSVADRAVILKKFHDALLARREEALDLIQIESGKTRRYSLEEILDTALVARHYAFRAARYLKPRRHRGAIPLLTTAWEQHHPIGVVGVIAPWNFPLILSITDLLAAIVAGNTAVLRPDVQSSFTALWAVDLLTQCGLPPNVVTVITGPGSVLGPALIDNVDFVMFTGSTRVGKTVARQAAERLIGCSLELGGKNSMIVLEDADLDAAVEGLVRGAFVGAGQVCVSIERAWLPASHYDTFCKKLAERVRRMRLSANFAYGPEMGSLTVPRQISSVHTHVSDAIAKGARLLTGGRTRPDIGPLFYEPTVLTGVTPEMKVYAEETFGPVVSLYRYDSLEEAVRGANDTPYGLNASIWSRNTGRARQIAARLRAGTVNINDCYAATWTATASPIGGMGESGSGRRHGAEGILKYTEAQTVAVQRLMPLGPPSWLSELRYEAFMAGLLRWMRRIPGLR